MLAAAVAISMLVALTLCPALSTKLLKGREDRAPQPDCSSAGSAPPQAGAARCSRAASTLRFSSCFSPR